MNLQIPEGANVHIIIGNAPPLALTDQRAELPARSGGRRLAGATFKVALVGLLVIGSFWVGEQRGQAADNYAGIAAPPPVEQAFPLQTPPGQAQPGQAPPGQAGPPQAAAAAPGQAPQGGVPAAGVPPNFAAQLQQPPTIQPAPGSASGNKNPFGLDTN
jgi:hypothetical protein